jgi:hypothetical protein
MFVSLCVPCVSPRVSPSVSLGCLCAVGVSLSCKMETVTLAYLQGLSPDARAGLGCVKVEGYSHTQLAVLVPQLGGTMCGRERCTTVIFSGWVGAKGKQLKRCSACKPLQSSCAGTSTPAQKMRDNYRQNQEAEAAAEP